VQRQTVRWIDGVEVLRRAILSITDRFESPCRRFVWCDDGAVREPKDVEVDRRPVCLDLLVDDRVVAVRERAEPLVPVLVLTRESFDPEIDVVRVGVDVIDRFAEAV